MTDKTGLVSIEEIINQAFGPLRQNTVNFKLIQTILHILARQLRLLGQNVEINFDVMGVGEYEDELDTGSSSVGSSDEETDKEDKTDKTTPKDKEGKRRSKGRERSRGRKHGSRGRSVGRDGSRTSITVTETSRGDGKGGQDKVLVVEKGSTHRDGGRVSRVGSIEVVTASQFALLENEVKKLARFTGPLPMPALPDNEQLRQELAKGTASFSDTMQAMQLIARMQAAEKGLLRMAGLLKQLAAAGVLPQDMAGLIGEMCAELQQALAVPDLVGAGTGHGAEGQKSVGIDPLKFEASGSARMTVGVTHVEMENVLQHMKDEISKKINDLTGRAIQSADLATNKSKAAAEKLDIAMNLDKRISELQSQTTDFAEHLKEFNTDFMSQMLCFQEQMLQLKTELNGGLTMLEQANNNAETAAVLGLTEQYEGLVAELDHTVQLHQKLTIMQKQLGDELGSLLKCVEILREQKADRDEVLDGLKDKADISSLTGLLQNQHLEDARKNMEEQLAKCHDQFHRQELVWQSVIKDLSGVGAEKAEHIQVVAFKENVEEEISNIYAILQQLNAMLGEPKAAILMRQLSKDGSCGTCGTRALMEPSPPAGDAPPRLPALRPPPPAAEEPCLTGLGSPIALPDTREHACHRWVGGSHTLMLNNVTREKAGVMNLQTVPTKKFVGYGTDGRIYLMEEELQPCLECNKLSTDETEGCDCNPLAPSGGGDHAGTPLATTEYCDQCGK